MTLPEPLTPPDCDLRGYDFMPLFGHRLFRSDLYESANAEEFRAALRLWWEAWNQCPAGSLPDDDARLARMVDLGRDLKSWRKMKDAAMRGFVLCSDGRLYHRLLCEWAMEAYARRVKDRERKRKWRGRGQDGDGDDGGCPAPRPRDEAQEGQGQNAEMHEQNADGPPLSHPSSAPRPRRVPVERRGEDRRGEELRKNFKNSSGTPPTGAHEASGSTEPEAVGPEKAAAVVLALQSATRMTAYPPRKAVRSPDEQIAAVAVERPRTAYLTPEQLAMARRRTA